MLEIEGVRRYREDAEREGTKPIVFKHAIALSSMGLQFAKACLGITPPPLPAANR